MPQELTLAEVEADLVATINDETICLEIAKLIRRFIIESGGEDRKAYVIDAMRWEAMAAKATRLKTIIRAKREELLQ